MTATFDVAVLGRMRDAATVAAGAGCVLAARADARAALVVTAGRAPAGLAARATPAAARLRERLAARDLAARAGGRLVWCGVDGAPAALRAAAAGVPTILAVCGPREDWLDGLLAEAGLVLVVGAPADPLTALVLGGLRDRGVRATAVPAPEGVRAGLARLGVGAPGAWRSLGPLTAEAPR